MKKLIKYCIVSLLVLCISGSIAYFIYKKSFENDVSNYLTLHYEDHNFEVLDSKYSFIAETMVAKVKDTKNNITFHVQYLNANLHDDYQELLTKKLIEHEVKLIVESIDIGDYILSMDVSFVSLDMNLEESRYELDVSFTDKIKDTEEFAKVSFELMKGLSTSNYSDIRFMRIYQDVKERSLYLGVYPYDYLGGSDEAVITQLSEKIT